jgi:hypothetical protein
MKRRRNSPVEITWGVALGSGWAILVFSILYSDWWQRPSQFLDALPGSEELPTDVQDAITGGPDPLTLVDGLPAIGWIELVLGFFAIFVLSLSFGRRATRKVPARAILVAASCIVGLVLGGVSMFVSPGGGGWTLGSAWIGMLIGWSLILGALGTVYFTWDSETVESAPEVPA